MDHDPSHCQMGRDSQLLHAYKIPLDHNLFLFHEFTQVTYNENTLVTYDSHINISQSKDQRFVKPPMEALHLILNIKECNPDKNIHAPQ